MSAVLPDAGGRFGDFGGRFAPETLMPALLELEEAFQEAWADDAFHAELDSLLRAFVAARRRCTGPPGCRRNSASTSC